MSLAEMYKNADYKDKNGMLFNDDCLEIMKNIPDESIDCIICDLPYGTTDCKWDSVIPFESLWGGYERIIKNDGAIILFGSEPFSSALRMSNLNLYKYDWVWNNEVKISLLVSKDNRLVNGVPYNDFKTPTKIMSFEKNDKKLKHYEIYDKYVNITYQKSSFSYKDLNISNRDKVVKYVLSKDLVPLAEIDNSYISLICENNGKDYYLTREYDKYFNPYIYVPKYCNQFVWENNDKIILFRYLFSRF